MFSKAKRAYTIMFVPDGEGKTFYIRLNKYFVQSLVVFIVVFLFGIGVFVFRSAVIAARLQLSFSVLSENRKLKDENAKLRTIVEKFQSIENTTEYLRHLAYAVGEGSLVPPVKQYASVQRAAIFTQDSVDKFTDDLHKALSSLSGLMKSPTGKSSVASIPTLAPLSGFVMKSATDDSSGASPSFDVTIVAPYLTPICATETGIVDDITQDVKQGLVISITHPDGYRTRYGHCASVILPLGMKVKRGETIALVGRPGIFGMPSLWYEVSRNSKVVNPVLFRLHNDN